MTFANEPQTILNPTKLMKTSKLFKASSGPRSLGAALLTLCLVAATGMLHAQGFNSGSTGAYGPMNITTNTTLDLPADGIFHCTTIDIGTNATLTFNRNALNTPVYLLATSNVTIRGIINVDGQNKLTTIPPVGSEGGPGGFDGGMPGLLGFPPGSGYGPGAGQGGTNTPGADGVGLGAYGGLPNPFKTNNGAIYGSPLLVPLVGGSGGGGSSAAGGAGGGGAILVASSTRIDVLTSGTAISARGGRVVVGNFPGHGSGGAIRLVAPVVAGAATLNVEGGSQNQQAGHGRIRVDAIDRKEFNLSFNPSTAASVGSFMVGIAPANAPQLNIVEAAGTNIAPGSGPVQVLLPFGSTTNRTVTVQARNFGGDVPIRVVLTPENGTPVTYDATINNTVSPAQTAVNVVMPVNQIVHVHAWTR